MRGRRLRVQLELQLSKMLYFLPFCLILWLSFLRGFWYRLQDSLVRLLFALKVGLSFGQKHLRTYWISRWSFMYHLSLIQGSLVVPPFEWFNLQRRQSIRWSRFKLTPFCFRFQGTIHFMHRRIASWIASCKSNELRTPLLQNFPAKLPHQTNPGSNRVHLSRIQATNQPSR